MPQPVLLGEVFPDFKCETTHGSFSFHEYLESDPAKPWTVFFGHPDDYTPVCTTELGRAEVLIEEFTKRKCKMIGISCNDVESHKGWTKDILCNIGSSAESLSYPIIADKSREIVVQLGMLDPAEIGKAGLPMPARYLSIIGPDKKLKLSILYPATTGRNFDEILRVLDSLQLTAEHALATPVDWVKGKRLVVTPPVSMEDAKAKFQNLEVKELPSGKPYLRFVDDPLAGC